MTNEEYVAELRARSTLSFVDDCRITLREIHDAMDRQQDDDETPRAYRERMGDARTRLERLLLRLQDGHIESR